MTKTELIQGVQERLNCTKKDAELAVNTVFEVLTDALVHDEKVAISKFGSFEVRLPIGTVTLLFFIVESLLFSEYFILTYLQINCQLIQKNHKALPPWFPVIMI